MTVFRWTTVLLPETGDREHPYRTLYSYVHNSGAGTNVIDSDVPFAAVPADLARLVAMIEQMHQTPGVRIVNATLLASQDLVPMRVQVTDNPERPYRYLVTYLMGEVFHHEHYDLPRQVSTYGDVSELREIVRVAKNSRDDVTIMSLTLVTGPAL